MSDDEEQYVAMLEQQKEEYRHIESLSQRFLQVLIAMVALALVFASQRWIDFFLNSTVPTADLVITCSGGGTIGGLSQTMVLNNGNLLAVLVLTGLSCVALSGVWSARVMFLDPPSYRLDIVGTQLSENEHTVRKARRFLRISYYLLGLGLVLLLLTGFGYWSFYFASGYQILFFDLVVAVFSFVLVFLFIPELTRYNISKETGSELISAGIPMNLVAASIAGIYFIFVYLNALKPLGIWLQIELMC